MRDLSCTGRLGTSLLAFFLTVFTLCPFAVGAVSQATGALELTSGQDMGAMQCGTSVCQSGRISTARQDSFQTIQDVLAHPTTVAAFETVVQPDLQQVGAGHLENQSRLKSVSNVPLYIRHVSLIR